MKFLDKGRYKYWIAVCLIYYIGLTNMTDIITEFNRVKNI